MRSRMTVKLSSRCRASCCKRLTFSRPIRSISLLSRRGDVHRSEGATVRSGMLSTGALRSETPTRSAVAREKEVDESGEGEGDAEERAEAEVEGNGTDMMCVCVCVCVSVCVWGEVC